MGTDARWADDQPAAYDELLGPALFAPFARELAGRAARLRPASVLELAAGPGILTEEAGRAGCPCVAVTATDLHPAMVRHGAARVPHGYADVDRLRADLAGAGPSGSVEQVALHGEAPSARALAEGFCRGTPLLFALQERGDVATLTDATAEQMTARLGDGPVSGPLAAFVVHPQPWLR